MSRKAGHFGVAHQVSQVVRAQIDSYIQSDTVSYSMFVFVFVNKKQIWEALSLCLKDIFST